MENNTEKESPGQLPRGARLRKALLQKITIVSFHDPLKGQDLTAAGFLHPLSEQRLDAFMRLMEPYLSTNRKK